MCVTLVACVDSINDCQVAKRKQPVQVDAGGEGEPKKMKRSKAKQLVDDKPGQSEQQEAVQADTQPLDEAWAPGKPASSQAAVRPPSQDGSQHLKDGQHDTQLLGESQLFEDAQPRTQALSQEGEDAPAEVQQDSQQPRSSAMELPSEDGQPCARQSGLTGGSRPR